MKISLLSGAVFAATALLAGPGHAEARLLMFDQPGCHWCAMWDAEIAPVYPKTDEAAIAPLSRQDIRAPLPEDVELASPPQFTPTFVLLDDGVEVGRIEGYPGADSFWGLLGAMLAKLPEREGAGL